MERFCLTQQICMPLFQLLLYDSVKSQLPVAILESGTSTLSSFKAPILFLADQTRAKATHWFWEMTFSTFFATWPWPLLTMKHAEMVDGRWSWKLMEMRYTNFKHCSFYLLNHETNCLIHILYLRICVGSGCRGNFANLRSFLPPFLPRRCLSDPTKNSLYNTSDSYYWNQCAPKAGFGTV